MYTIQLKIEGCVDCPWHEYTEGIGYAGDICELKHKPLQNVSREVPEWCPILVKEDKGENSDNLCK